MAKMMLQHFDKLKHTYRVFLASQSPRRKEILERLHGLSFAQITSPFDERTLSKDGRTPQEFVEVSAVSKANGLLEQLIGDVKVSNSDASEDTDSHSATSTLEPLVIGADTVVVLDGKIMEKPKDAAENLHFLQQMNGTSHLVCAHLAKCTYFRQIFLTRG